MKSILSFLQPAPHIKEIEDASEVKGLYGYWRVRILYSMFVGYAFYYFTRKSFTFAMPGLIDDLGFVKGDLGLLASIFSITYGISKFASGVLSDRSNSRYFMAIGLMITGILNICFGFSSSLIMFCLFWGLNGWFQGFGWPPCARFLTHWYSQSERGRWWAIWNVSHNVGAFIIPWIVGACLHYFGWRYGLYVPGIICILGGFFLINRLRDTPQSIGLPPIEQFRNDYTGVIRCEVGKEKRFSAREVLKVVVKNKYLWVLGFAYFFVYIVRTGIGDWTALYLLETKGYSRIGASGCASLFEVGGFFGSLFAGWSSDRLSNANRGPVNVLFALGALLGIIGFWSVPAGNPLLDSMSMFIIGFSIFGPQMLIGMVAAELSPKQAAATASGFVGCFAYTGAAIAGYPLGAITDAWGWNGFFWALAAGGMISVLILLPLWGVKENVREPVAA
jgi:OPA family sugar phosphate sensor protein UhpC-like MFS transporter